MAARQKKRSKREVVFDDENTVLAEMAEALKIDPDDLKIRESRNLAGFGVGTIYEISVRGGHSEWQVAENADQARELAIEIVKQDLEEDPSMFNREFIESHIDMKRLRRELESDVQSQNEDYLRDLSDREFWRTAESYIDIPEEDEDGDMPDPDEYIDEVAEKMTEEKLRDPMEYLEEFGDDAVKKAIEIAGIDVDAAAEEAVDADGEGHFLGHYDSETHETPSGLVYWRTN